MKETEMFKPSKKHFTILLGSLVFILLLFGGLRWKFGQFLPDLIDKNLPDAVIIAAVGVMLWNRQILNQEKKEAEAKKAAEAAAAAELEESEESEDEVDGDDSASDSETKKTEKAGDD
jgi:hypothetical protein